MPINRCITLTPLLIVLCTGILISANATAENTLTAEQDHTYMLEQLGIKHLRRGADGDPRSEHAANYDEANANGNMGSLPELLKLQNGTPVTTPEHWWSTRRPEIMALFDQEIYGYTPHTLPAVSWEIKNKIATTKANIAVITHELMGTIDNSTHPAISVSIRLNLTLPAQQKQPVPVVLQHSFDPEVLARLLSRFSPEQIKSFNGNAIPWDEQIIAKGWGYAELISTSVQADSGSGLREGIIGLANKGQPRSPEEWGTLKAWSWAASEALNYFEKTPSVDASKVAIAGHSRFGKTALVTMAYDQRFAAAYISSSGEGGAKLWRRNFGEQIGNIAGSGEYHWVAGNFIRYAGLLTANDLPVDAHQLIALCAPRPVFISSGNNGDQWVDPKGMFLAALHASPAYVLLGKNPLSGDVFPPVGTGLLDGDIAFKQHSGGHTAGPNWALFLAFFDKHIQTQANQ
ncbi:alpha/beta hydrolase family protein [Teredinibacter purpureus]|uniref:alpha/beta hydrolase family protein n=1 Tax=Teredinibacter purpureus TaxID=2731756 RepID=UPI0009E1E0D2|nr:acetylxylan esterase [Teredinibacter purpureus]